MTMGAKEVKAFLTNGINKHTANGGRLKERKHLEQILASRFDAALDGDSNKRKRAMYELSLVSSFTELELPELLAYRDWLGTEGGYGVVTEQVANEARAVYDDAIGEKA